MSKRSDSGRSSSSRSSTPSSFGASCRSSGRSPVRTKPLTAAQAALLEAAQEQGRPTDFSVPVRGGTANALRALTRRGLIDDWGAITPDGADALTLYRLQEEVCPGE